MFCINFLLNLEEIFEKPAIRPSKRMVYHFFQ